MKQILVIVFPIFLPLFLGEFNPMAGCGSPQAGKARPPSPGTTGFHPRCKHLRPGLGYSRLLALGELEGTLRHD